jgi:hypothetical protein
VVAVFFVDLSKINPIIEPNSINKLEPKLRVKEIVQSGHLVQHLTGDRILSRNVKYNAPRSKPFVLECDGRYGGKIVAQAKAFSNLKDRLNAIMFNGYCTLQKFNTLYSKSKVTSYYSSFFYSESKVTSYYSSLFYSESKGTRYYSSLKPHLEIGPKTEKRT